MSWQMHYNSDDADLFTYLADPSVFAVKDGYVTTPSGPGLGIVVNEDLVRTRAKEHSRVGVEAWRNPIWRGEDGSIREW
jgi:galactonate dehydratase